jgi:hypothetical protein
MRWAEPDPHLRAAACCAAGPVHGDIVQARGPRRGPPPASLPHPHPSFASAGPAALEPTGREAAMRELGEPLSRSSPESVCTASRYFCR